MWRSGPGLHWSLLPSEPRRPQDERVCQLPPSFGHRGKIPSKASFHTRGQLRAPCGEGPGPGPSRPSMSSAVCCSLSSPLCPSSFPVV